MIHTIKFDRNVVYTGAGGVVEGLAFKKVLADGRVVETAVDITHIADTVFPTDTIAYNVTWVELPEPGKGYRVELDYDDVAGAYEDEEGNALEAQLVTMTICDPRVIQPPFLSDIDDTTITVGEQVDYDLKSHIINNGGDLNITWRVSSGSLPNGLTLNELTGVISGVPTTEAAFSVGYTATNSAGDSNEIAHTITVSGTVSPPILSPIDDFTITQGQPVNYDMKTHLQSDGGDPVITWSSTGLPDGLSLDANTGLITGSPTTIAVSTVTYTATNSAGDSNVISHDVTVVADVTPPVLSPISDFNVLVGSAVNYDLNDHVVSDGGSPITAWSVSTGSLPSGLSLDSATGIISGTADTISLSNVGYTAFNAAGSSNEITHAIDVTALKAIVGWTDGVGCVGGLTVVRFNGEVDFTDQTGVWFHNRTTGESVQPTTATVTPASDIEYSVPWSTPPVAGDVVEWEYDGSGNYVDPNKQNTVVHFYDEFLSADGVQVISAEHKATITVDETGNGWAGSAGIINDGAGHATGTNFSHVNFVLNEIVQSVKFSFFILPNTTESNSTSIVIRRVITGNGQNEIRGLIRRNIGQGVDIIIQNVLDNAVSNAASLNGLSIDLNTLQTFEVVDDGTGITLTHIESGESVYAENALLNHPPSLYAGINVGSLGLETFIDNILVDEIVNEPLAPQILTLENCAG